jgi:hypothetical protein
MVESCKMMEPKFELERLPRNCGNNVLIDEILRVALHVDSRCLTRQEFDKHAKISSSTVVKRFGGWGAALKRAG